MPASPEAPLLAPERITGNDRIQTIADPFPVSIADRLLVLAEIEGHRSCGRYFKKLGAFEIARDLDSATWLGELWPEDDGEYSYPFVFRDADRFLLIPDVNLPGQPAQKRFRIYQCAVADFPFGWKALPHSGLPGSHRSSDKVLLRQDGTWYLFVSDAAGGGRLLLYLSGDLANWKPHPRSPVLHRSGVERIVNRMVPPRLYPQRPWRLGGGTVKVGGRDVLFLQTMLRRRVYGEAVLPLLIEQLDESEVRLQMGRSPVLQAGPAVPWQRMSAHQVAFAPWRDAHVVVTDGFDGRFWRSTVQKYSAPAELNFSAGGEWDG